MKLVGKILKDDNRDAWYDAIMKLCENCMVHTALDDIMVCLRQLAPMGTAGPHRQGHHASSAR